MFYGPAVLCVVEYDGPSLSGDADYLTLAKVEFYLPCSLPGFQPVQISLEGHGILVGLDGEITHSVIHKEAYCRV